MVDGVRHALRFLFISWSRPSVSNTQVGYLMHCFSSLWEDSDEASSAATSLDIPDLADVKHRTGRARRQPRSSRSATSRGGSANNDPGRASADVPASSSSGPAPPAAPRGSAWADAQDERDVPEPEPNAAPGYVFGPPGPLLGDDTESEPDAEILGPAVPPGDEDSGGRTPTLQHQYDRIGNIWRWPSDPMAGFPQGHVVQVPVNTAGPGTLPPLHMSVALPLVPCTRVWP